MNGIFNTVAWNTQNEAPLVLVVEDDEMIRRLILQSLTKEGLSCISANSVSEAMATLETHRVAVTILDWQLDRCAADVLQEARRKYPRMSVLVISGRPDCDVRTDALLGEADAFLAKPFSTSVLSSQVRQMLKRTEPVSPVVLPETPEAIRPLWEIKERYIRHVVHLLDGNISLAAEKLGIHRQTIGSALHGSRSSDGSAISRPD
jgi:DNA-binding NtrC family response regulator